MSLLTGLADYLSDNIVNLSWNPSGASYASNETGIYLLSLPESPDSGVGLFPYAGPDSTPKLGYDSPNVQALVRGSRDPRDGLGLAQGIYNRLHGLSEHEFEEDTYVTVAVCLQSGPNYIGKDANNRHLFTVNTRFQIRNPTVHRETPV